jgi:hypothetical protein
MYNFEEAATARRKEISYQIDEKSVWIFDHAKGLFNPPPLTERMADSTPSSDRSAISEAVKQERFNIPYIKNQLRLLKKEYNDDPCIPPKFLNDANLQMHYFRSKFVDIRKNGLYH